MSGVGRIEGRDARQHFIEVEASHEAGAALLWAYFSDGLQAIIDVVGGLGREAGFCDLALYASS